MGTLGKIYLRFDAPWWASEEHPAGIAFLFNETSNYTAASAAKDWTRGIGYATPVTYRYVHKISE